MAGTKSFSLREAEVCCKCGTRMPIGTEVSWLRDPEARGFFHISCGHLPAHPGLVLRKRPDPTQAIGYVWARVGNASSLPPRTQPKAIMALPDANTLSTAPVATQAPAPPGVLEALAKALQPFLAVQVAAQVDAVLAKVTVRVQREAA